MSGEAAHLVANPSRFVLAFFAVAAALLALFCLLPILLLLASFGGLVPLDLNILLIAVPTAGIGIICTVILWSVSGDLLLPRPVLVIDGTGVLDRRVSDVPIRWSDVAAATSLLRGHGGVVLELREALPTRLNPFRAGTLLFQRPEPGVAHIPVLAMTVPAASLVQAMLEHAEGHGARVGDATTHPRMQRRSLF